MYHSFFVHLSIGGHFSLNYVPHLIASEQTQWLSIFCFPVGDKRMSACFPYHKELCIIMFCFYFCSTPVSVGGQGTALVNLPDVLLGFQPRKRKTCNHVRPIASSHFLVFPPSHAHTGTGFTLSQVCQVCSFLSHPWLWPVVGTIGWIGWKDKSYFLIILFIEHSRTLPSISLQMPSHWPCEIVLRIKWDCIKGVDKMQRTIQNVR